MGGQPSYRDETRLPRWVKVQGVVLLLLIVTVIGMSTGVAGLLIGLLGGDHGAGTGHE